ncbi:MAG: biotin/lipoyl-binding protein [Puniceicoccaceae bacterium]|nr:MAG: biotin/lipoyl-binding protein [Puniceicoccaceae bacterium]
MKRLKVTVEGKSYEVEIEILDEGAAPTASRRVSASSRVDAPLTSAKPKVVAPVASLDGDNIVTSPLGAVVVSIDVNIGDAVAEGQQVVTLEAMKMNTIVSASSSGTVKAVHVKPGDGVEEGQALIEFA